MELTWLISTSLVLLPLAFLLLFKVQKKQGLPLPPGPTAVPLLGNLVWLTIPDHMVFMSTLRSLHARYGPVIGLRMGSSLEVNVADRCLAHTALVERGAAVADRPELAARDLLGHNSAFTITSSNYGPRWRQLRRNFAAGFAQPARLVLFAPERERALAQLSDKLWRRQQEEEKLKAKGDSIMSMFQHAMCGIMLAMCFGERLGESAVRDALAALRDMSLYSATELGVFAILPSVTTRIFRGRVQAMVAKRQRLKDIYLPLIDARRKMPTPAAGTTLPYSYVDSLLDMKLSDDEIAGLCSEFLIGGIELPASALQ